MNKNKFSYAIHIIITLLFCAEVITHSGEGSFDLSSELDSYSQNTLKVTKRNSTYKKKIGVNNFDCNENSCTDNEHPCSHHHSHTLDLTSHKEKLIELKPNTYLSSNNWKEYKIYKKLFSKSLFRPPVRS